MSEKRRDSKNRVLRTGEQQRKDGKYLFSYIDANGKRQFVYSWKLEKTDKLPAGKRDCVALRELEIEIQKALQDSISYRAGDMTVLQLVEKYISLKQGVRPSTKVGYQTVVNQLKRDAGFSSRKINQIKISDAKEYLINLQRVAKKGYSSIHNIRGVLRPAFQMAMDDDLIRKNPFQFELVSVIVNDSITREAITKKQQRQFLEFVRVDKHFNRYYDGMFILFNTGMRISEFCGLTIKDIDMKARTINIKRQLQRMPNMDYNVELPKTDAGERTLPMNEEVYECFKRVVANYKKRKVQPTIKDADGTIYSGFLFLDKNRKPEVALHWENHFRWALAKYNRTYKEELPSITPHVARHTYCTNMAKSGMNPKVLQYLMGHSDISITLGIYTHMDSETAKEEVERIYAVNE